MTLTTDEKLDRLEMAIALLQDADAMIQTALGASDSCYETHNAIEEIISDLEADIEDLERRAEEEV